VSVQLYRYGGFSLQSRSLGALVSFLLVALSIPAYALNRQPISHSGERTAVRTLETGPDISLYRHLGAWVDMYDKAPWKNPEAAVAEMAQRGVTTLYLQTSNWGRKNDMYKPDKVARFIDAGKIYGVKMVAWYVPSFKNLKRDLRRTMLAIKVKTASGNRFDSFAMDIEATEVDSISRRNSRMLELSRTVRRRVGANYAMGAIIPDVQSLYWPSFPYKSVANLYDVFMPMAYFSYRTSGEENVRNYTLANLTTIRERVGRAVPIHPIGGIAGRTTARETRGYVSAVIDGGGIGGSYYDFAITTDREWGKLSLLAKPGANT
jgi:hypothetical protein